MKHSVALLIESSNEYARGLLRGILRFQQEHERWITELPEQHRGAAPPEWLRRYKGSGIIARIETRAVARAVRATGLPCVDVSAARFIKDIPWVETDDDSIGEIAFNHFFDKGIRNVAYCGEAGFNWSRWRGESFSKYALAKGIKPDIFEVSANSTWAKERLRLKRWLRRLPKPCGLFAAYDSLARRVIQKCAGAGLLVPDDIAVLGVDNDPLLCQLATPALSSVIPDCEQAGYLAAHKLDQMMSGQKVHADSFLLPPVGVATRRSTDTLAVDDQEVAKAARFILSEACNGIRVGDVVSQSDLTRRILESRFKQQLGKTPHQLIVETRLAKAEELLRESRLTLDQIARNCGIEYAEYLSTLFRKHRGVTPGEYRRQNQSRQDA